LSVLQNLSIFARLYGVKDRTRRIKTLIERFDLTKFRNRKCGVLSSGEQTRVGIVKALLNEPALLLLDEPTSSIDPSVARTIRDHIREVVRDSHCAVLWTSHNMQEVEEVCDQVHFLFKGELLLSGDPKTLAKKHDKTNLEELFISLARKPLF
ncbi:MAG: ATP-binding cassette domain-containing protein, partial [Candidatus Omnitrophica bacterium]|nr:ATP-binding cassette domain-containing protein [Candidatus Omnitrophota bacterium]